MDLKKLQEQRQEQDRKIAHAERFGEDDWPDGTVILISTRLNDKDGSKRLSRSAVTKQSGRWFNTSGRHDHDWETIVASLYRLDIASLAVVTDSIPFDDYRLQQRRDAEKDLARAQG